MKKYIGLLNFFLLSSIFTGCPSSEVPESSSALTSKKSKLDIRLGIEDYLGDISTKDQLAYRNFVIENPSDKEITLKNIEGFQPPFGLKGPFMENLRNCQNGILKAHQKCSVRIEITGPQAAGELNQNLVLIYSIDGIEKRQKFILRIKIAQILDLKAKTLDFDDVEAGKPTEINWTLENPNSDGVYKIDFLPSTPEIKIIDEKECRSLGVREQCVVKAQLNTNKLGKFQGTVSLTWKIGENNGESRFDVTANVK